MRGDPIWNIPLFLIRADSNFFLAAFLQFTCNDGVSIRNSVH